MEPCGTLSDEEHVDITQGILDVFHYLNNQLIEQTKRGTHDLTAENTKTENLI